MPSLDAIRALFAKSPEPVIALDAQGVLAFENEAARTLFEGRIPAALRECLAAKKTSFDWGEPAPSGVKYWYASTATPLDGGGVLVTCTNMTETKKNELRLRRSEELLVDTQGVAHLGTWEWDVSEPHATWSAELYRIYGLTPEEYTPSYEAYLTKVHPDDRQRVKDATDRVFHQHVPYSHDERIFRPDGSIRHLHTWAFPVLDDAGTLVRLVGVCQDITDRKAAEDEVLRLNADLEQRVADRVKDLEAFQAMLSHDLRAPLSVISMAAGLLATDTSITPSAPASKNVERIRRSVGQMTKLVEELLVLARVGNTKLEVAPVDVTALAQEVVQTLKREHPEQKPEVAIAPGLTTRGDANLVKTVLENLVGNAWKYSSRAPEPRIEIGKKEEAFFVKDNGAGFDPGEAHRLFQPFERLHKKEDFDGTGVGLAAVKRIIDRHRGRVWAEGQPGKGATFFFSL